MTTRSREPARLLAVLVLVCVPGLTRMSQKLETASHAPSFAKNIDCPPKKVTVTPATAVASPVPLANFDLVPLHAVPRLFPTQRRRAPPTSSGLVRSARLRQLSSPSPFFTQVVSDVEVRRVGRHEACTTSEVKSARTSRFVGLGIAAEEECAPVTVLTPELVEQVPTIRQRVGIERD